MPRKGTTRTHRCPNDHPHTVNCYKVHGCGCERCLDANSTHHREWRKRAAYGRLQVRVDPGPSRDRLLELRAAGWTKTMLADATGMNVAHLQRITNRTPAWVTVETETRILAVTERPVLRPEALVPNVATARQLQGLFRHGWTLTFLAARLGKSVQQVWVLMRQPYVTEATRRAVDALTRELGTATPSGPFTARTAARAAAHGYVSLLAWDDITDENEQPKGVAA